MKKKDKFAQSTLQTIKFFEEFIRKTKVVKFVKEYRKLLNIPINGIPFMKKEQEELSDPISIFFYTPKEISSETGKNGEQFNSVKMMNTCIAFVKQEGINSIYIQTMFRLFIIFNEVIDIPLKILGSDKENDFLKIQHMPTELSWFDKEDYYLLQCMYEQFNEIGKKYPVAIYINPDASQRQIKDFISRRWKLIKSYRNEKQKSLNRIRTKKKQKRNDFIYKNRHLKLAQIRRRLAEELEEFLDDGHIGKIIQIEKKRRN